MGVNATMGDFCNVMLIESLLASTPPQLENMRATIVINFIGVAVHEEQDTDGVDKGRDGFIVAKSLSLYSQ